MKEQTIFISVASYCDPMLEFTLRSAIMQASNPDRIRIGIVEQTFPKEQLRLTEAWAKNFRWSRVHALLAQGPCWARSIAMSLYQGEDWFLQIDSHTWFQQGWDDYLINWGRQLSQKSIIGSYPFAFTMCDGKPHAPVVNGLLAHAVTRNSKFEANSYYLRFEATPLANTDPIVGIHLAGGCLFASGSIIAALPYDPVLYFNGEEQALTLRAYTHGWDIIHIPNLPMYHLYMVHSETQRSLHWTPEHDVQRVVKSAQRNTESNSRLKSLIYGQDLGRFSLGQERSLDDYAKFSGIDYLARTISDSARVGRYCPTRPAFSTAVLNATSTPD